MTVHKNLLALDVERDFLTFYRTKADCRGYTGLGKLIDSAVRFAAYTKDEQGDGPEETARGPKRLPPRRPTATSA